jgi:hypothetical protein
LFSSYRNVFCSVIVDQTCGSSSSAPRYRYSSSYSSFARVRYDGAGWSPRMSTKSLVQAASAQAGWVSVPSIGGGVVVRWAL